jgi:DnaJ-class molecular chaperone
MISRRRIKYSASLADMLKARLRPGMMKHRDILHNLGQDIEIFITPIEARLGAVAYIELPARMYCPLCSGSDAACYLCNGIGRISTSSQLEVRSPPHVDDSTTIDIDLMGMRPDRGTSFTMKSLRIKITIIRREGNRE